MKTKLKKIWKWTKVVAFITLAVLIYLVATGKLTQTITQTEVISLKEKRITELKESEQGQRVLELWAKEQYALEQKAEAEKALEEVRAESLSLE